MKGSNSAKRPGLGPPDDVFDLLLADRAETSTAILPLTEGAVVAEAHVAAAVQHGVDV